MRADEGVSKGRACDGPGDLAPMTAMAWWNSSTGAWTGTGPGWQAVTDGVEGAEGWPLYLDRYAALIREGR
jgi:hypothetical protein